MSNRWVYVANRGHHTTWQWPISWVNRYKVVQYERSEMVVQMKKEHSDRPSPSASLSVLVWHYIECWDFQDWQKVVSMLGTIFRLWIVLGCVWMPEKRPLHQKRGPHRESMSMRESCCALIMLKASDGDVWWLGVLVDLQDVRKWFILGKDIHERPRPVGKRLLRLSEFSTMYILVWYS